MKIKVFSDNDSLGDAFSPIKQSMESWHETRKIKESLDLNAIHYLDLTGLSKAQRTRYKKMIYKEEEYCICLIDTAKGEEDIAEWFHNGACDFVIAENQTKINKARIATVWDFFKSKFESDEGFYDEDLYDHDFSGTNWANVIPGNTYIFALLYVEFDNHEQLKIKLGKDLYQETLQIFSNHIQSTYLKINGRVWMWNETHGVILFPYDGKNCEAILETFRMRLNTVLTAIERYGSNILPTYKMILHAGETTYADRGRTSNIISPTLNTLFHLGQRYAQQNSFYLTGTLYKNIPKGLESCFVEESSYEGVNIYRMLSPV